MLKKALLFVLVFAFVASCSKGGGNVGYAAKVGDLKITVDDVQSELASLPADEKGRYKGADGMGRLLEDIVKREALYLEAVKRGLDRNDAARRLGDAAATEAKKSGASEKEISRRYKTVFADYLLDMVKNSPPRPSGPEILACYNSHKDEFPVSYEVRLARIAVKGTENSPEVGRVFYRVRSGEDFAKVASSVSIDKTTSANGGDMGYINPLTDAKLDPDELMMVLIMQKGAVSGPVVVRDEVHIVKMLDAKGDPAEFEKTATRLLRRVVADKLMEGLKKEYKVEIYKDSVSKLTQVPKAGPAAPISGSQPGKTR
jgi:parvulin-like peptidyl-prolyl isomerase